MAESSKQQSRSDADRPYRSAQEAQKGMTLQEQMREQIFKMRGARAYLFQAAADRLDEFERLLAARSERGPSADAMRQHCFLILRGAAMNARIAGKEQAADVLDGLLPLILEAEPFEQSNERSDHG